MKISKLNILWACFVFIAGIGEHTTLQADNQTPTVSEVLSDDSLPFRIKLKMADFVLPIGIQSYVHGMYHNKWLIVTGRIDGMHGFVQGSKENFPVNQQNTYVFVVDPIEKKIFVRSLQDPASGLTQAQVDLLSVTAAQGYQSGKTLYIAGGYGVDSATGQLNTKNALTAIDIPGLIHWVVDPHPKENAAQYIRQIFDNIFKVTGGYMNQVGDYPTLLIMGHEFNGFYEDPTQDPPVYQQYTEQVRRFHIHDDGHHLSITTLPTLPHVPDPNYRRRDLHVVPIVKKAGNKLVKSFSVLSGVFTLTDGVWTVPVEVNRKGRSSMADPSLPDTFKQGMNNYDSATFGMFSKKTGEMYTLLLGGISFGFFEETSTGLSFNTDTLFPFINQTTTIRIDKKGRYTQHLMKEGGFPFIPSETVNAGNPLLFGTESEVFFLHHIPRYGNDVIKLDSITKPTLIGYVIGGIASTLPNTNTQADSFPSKYIFEIIVEPKKRKCD